MAAATVLAFAHQSAQAKTTLDVTQPNSQVTGTATTGGQFIVSYSPTQPTGTGVIDSFLRIQQTGQERGYNTSLGFPLDDKTPVNYTHAIQLQNIPIVNIGGTDYREFLMDANQVQDGPLSMNQVQIFTSAADVGASGYTLNEADTTHDATISFPGATLAFSMNAGQNNGTDLATNNEVWIDSGHGSGSGDMFLYVNNAVFTSASPTTYVTLFSQFGHPSGTYYSNDGFEEWAVVGRGQPVTVPEPTSVAMTLTALAGFGLVGLRRLRRRPDLTSA